MFTTEQEMSDLFEKYLKDNFGNAYLKQCQGLFGVPDFVFYTKTKDNTLVVSFELKLKSWKRAIIQAFRYRSFSCMVYVVLPQNTIDVALRNIDIFEHYNIGLMKFDKNYECEVLYKPRTIEPYSDLMTTKILNIIGKSKKRVKSIETFWDIFI